MSHSSHAPVHEIPDDVLARRWWILVVLCTSLMIIIVGNTSLNVALPTLARQLDADATALQWMVDAYGLVFAGLLFMAGALGDRYGRKGALQFGLTVFLGGALIAAFAGSAVVVVAGRAVMGIGAAFVMPSTLSILANSFPVHERAKAIAIWAGISGGGAAIGPIASGFLLEHFWWGSVFLVNVPIIVVALVAGKILLPTSRDPEEAPLDVIGALLSVAGMVTLVYAIIEAPGNGWLSTESIGLFAAAIALLGIFVAWELRTSRPMLDLRYFLNPRFSVAAGGIALVFFAMFGMFFLITQYFQLVLGYGTLEAGVKQFPVAVCMMLIAPQSARLVARLGAGVVVASGLGLVTVGQLLMATVTRVDSPYVVILVALCVTACGMALTMAPLTASIMSSIPMGKAGVGSAMNDTTRELGGALGVAVLGSVVSTRFTGLLGDSLGRLSGVDRSVAESGLAGALQVAGKLNDGALASTARSAYVSAFHLAAFVAAAIAAAARVAAAIAAAAALVVLKFMPGRPAAVGAVDQAGAQQTRPRPARFAS